MKRVLVAVLAVTFVLCGGLAMAEDKTEGTTGRGVYTTPISPITQWLNENEEVYHSHKYDKLDDIYGYGADIKLIDFKKLIDQPILDSLEAQYRYDMKNEIHSVYGVVQIDLTFWQ